MDQGSPKAFKAPSEGHNNFTSSGAGSLVIHQESESDAYIESTGHLSEVNEDQIAENPEFYHGLSLKFYGQEMNMSQGGSELQLKSEPEQFSEDNQSDCNGKEGNGNSTKSNYLQVRSYTDLTTNVKETRRKRSNIDYSYVYQDHEKLKELREINKRMTNKSDNVTRVKGILEMYQGKVKNNEGLEDEKARDGDGGDEKKSNLPFYFNRKEVPGQGGFGLGRRAKAVKNLP